ncbi:MAG: gliding motility-associated ABC transporter ATP-binding subunit GldA [Bacteroidetes bacterium]|nr:gliding motility-associated ABC transporter ATP-binding subunit GldA [Bacteroidota bacterium]
MSIKVNSITKLYGTQKALDAVSFEIAPGEVVGLLGPNGAGKSTIMKILTCFIPPTSGDASVCNFDILEQSIEVRKKVGYLPENNPLYLDLYVEEFLSFIDGILAASGIQSRKGGISASLQHPASGSRQRIADVIELTGLTAEKHKKIGALSKGYRQRVGLAQALLHDPEVLILDEPTSGLDPNQLLEIRSLIKTIGKEKTVMLSTHIMQEVEAICDRAIIIHKGKIVADDSTGNLHKISSSGNIVSVEFSSEVNAGVLATIPGVSMVKQVSPVSFQLTAKNNFDIRPDVFRFAVDNKLTVLSLQKEELKLEEVFQELTKD